MTTQKKSKCLILNDLLEIRTSIAITTSVLAGSFYAYWVTHQLNIALFLSMLLAAICLDAAATVFNHYFDYKKAKEKKGYAYNIHNPIVFYNLKPKNAYIIGGILLVIAGFLGIYIFYYTSTILIIIGLISFLVVYFYSAGPMPIAYTPFGEIFSGFFEGMIAFGIAYYIQTLSYTLDPLIISIIITLNISNIMLANNIGDLEEDRKNERRTLPIVLGLKGAFYTLYFNTFILWLLLITTTIVGLLPKITFGLLIILPYIIWNILRFKRDVHKAIGFKFILINSLITNLGLAILLILSIFL